MNSPRKTIDLVYTWLKLAEIASNGKKRAYYNHNIRLLARLLYLDEVTAPGSKSVEYRAGNPYTVSRYA